MGGKFEGDGERGNFDVDTSWLKPVIGIIFFTVVVSIFFKALTFLLPIVIIGALIFFGIRFFNQNDAERERWQAWGKQFGEDAARWGKDFGERAADWAKQMQARTTCHSEDADSTAQTSQERPHKRKNDEDVLEVDYEEYEEVPSERPKAKRHAESQEYL